MQGDPVSMRPLPCKTSIQNWVRSLPCCQVIHPMLSRRWYLHAVWNWISTVFLRKTFMVLLTKYSNEVNHIQTVLFCLAFIALDLCNVFFRMFNSTLADLICFYIPNLCKTFLSEAEFPCVNGLHVVSDAFSLMIVFAKLFKTGCRLNF